MIAGKKIFALIGTLAFGAGSSAAATAAELHQCQAPATPQIAEECACQAALNAHSEAALSKFLRKYPSSDTACGTLALSNTRPDNDDRIVVASPN
jgi:hypothetical protein